MIAKIVKGRGFKGAVNYILDAEKGTKLLDAEGVRLKNKASIIQSFITQAKLNPKLVKSVGHISLSFSVQDKDKITDQMMLQVAREYMRRMNIKEAQYIVARHFDKEHPHIHLCFNRVDNNGKTISDKNDRFRSEKICKELTAEYGLYLSSGKEQVKTNRLKEPDKTKYEIYSALKELVPKVRGWDQLKQSLNRQHIDIHFKTKGHTDEIQGVTFTKNGYSFTGSKIDRMFSYSKIDNQLSQNNHMERNMQQTANSPSYPDRSIESLISSIGGLFDFQPNGTNHEDEILANKLYNRKKKKKKGRRL